MKKHHYNVSIQWTGNLGSGTSGYRAYSRNHEIKVSNKPPIPASSDPAFRGDPTRYNPEELFVAALSQCHMLWFLHLCADAGIVVTSYLDEATGVMEENQQGGGHFTEVVLRPLVKTESTVPIEKIDALHHQANTLCFIANSCKFPVRHEGRLAD